MRNGKHAAVAYYRDIDGRTRQMMRTGASGAKAEANLLAALRSHLTPTVDYLTPDSTLESLASQWLDEVERSKKATSTLHRYRAVINKHLNEHVGAIRIKEANVPRLQRIVDLVSDTNGASQARILGVIFKGMFGMATRHGATRDNPAAHLRLPVVEAKPVRVPTMEDLATLFELLAAYDKGLKGRATKRDMVDFAGMMLATGGRIGEVLALDLKLDFDYANQTAHLQSTLTNAPGKGLHRSKPKSNSSDRIVKLSDWGWSIVLRRRESALTSWLFESDARTARWPEAVRTQWREALKGSSIDWMTPHDLRKAVATLLGTDDAKEQLGHSSSSVTTKHYIQYDPTRPDQSSALEVFGPLVLAAA
ncbi:tyrosine-type recombinase/integrase [Leucobacter allii]|uniref:tyrosine-type recombinase/integrase n=1 Tax=Leucobacter allii TaxID=2932247 RepID=UPI001FD25F61|nr:tyrosine-type recombinase/integrase [Leucobacter allii]UOR02005.1 tyrosine-type recombinase/integrase [Leucobacter allii]